MCDATPLRPLVPSTQAIEGALKVVEQSYPVESAEWKIASKIFARNLIAVTEPKKLARFFLILNRLEEGFKNINAACFRRQLIYDLLDDLDVRPTEDRSVFVGFGPCHLQIVSDDEDIRILDDRLSVIDARLTESLFHRVRTLGEEEARAQFDDLSEENGTPRKYWWWYPVRCYKIAQESHPT